MATLDGGMIPLEIRRRTVAQGSASMTIARVVRRATVDDIADMMALRMSVRENRLSHPGQVTAEDCLPYVQRGHIWIWEEDQEILGLSASDCAAGSIWALFVRPGHEGRGI